MSPRLRGVLPIIVAAMAFATSGPLGRVSAPIPAIAVAALRTGLAAIVLIAVDLPGFVTSLRGLTRKQRVGVGVAGALLGAHLALFLAGLTATSFAAAIALVSLEPLSVVIAAFALFRLKPTRLELVGLITATLGALVVSSGAGEGEHRLAGDLIVLVAVAIFGAYVASARGLRDALPATHYAGAVYGTSALVLLPFAIPFGIGAPTVKASAAVLGLAFIPTLIGHTLVQRAARTAPPTLVALVSPGETVGGILIGAAFMNTPPTLREGIGAAIVLAGATLAIFGQRGQESTATTGA